MVMGSGQGSVGLFTAGLLPPRRPSSGPRAATTVGTTFPYRLSTGWPPAIETRLNALMRVVVHSTAEICAVVR